MTSVSTLVCIAFTADPARLPRQLEQLRCLAEWPGPVTVRLATASSAEDVDRARAAFRLLETCGMPIVIDRVGPFDDDPFKLTWAHKTLLRDEFLATGSPFTHFVYLEDDIRFTWRNMAYWLSSRPALAAKGLLPGMLRYEFARGQAFLTDLTYPQTITNRPSVFHQGYQFLNVWPPYHALAVYDRALAMEHVLSRSFDYAASRYFPDYGTPERANMAQTFENVPTGFTSRYVVPVTAERLPLYDCLVHHLPNNYAENSGKPGDFGSLPIEDGFTP